MTNPPVDNSDAHPVVVTVYDIEAGPGVVRESLTFYGDCVTSGRSCAEGWLRQQGFIPINVDATWWEEQGIGSLQATLEETS